MSEDLAEQIANRCEEAHPYQNGWRARCPAHQGKSNTSLSIEMSTDRVLVHCHADCPTRAVVAALGLTLADLFLPDIPSSQDTPSRIVKIYDYVNAEGILQHQTVRFDPKKFLQRRPDPAHPGTEIWNLKTITPVLYHLPQVIESVRRGETIYVVEGEKDADALMAHGVTATCNPMGAGKWGQNYTDVLRNADVVILPHNDSPGKNHAVQVKTALHGTAHRVTIIYLPGLPEKGGDVWDWLHAGGTIETLKHIEQAQQNGTTIPPQDTQLSHKNQPAMVSMGNVIAEDVQWLWWPYLALGKLAMLDGEPGVGKSLLSVTLAAILSQGWPLPDQQGGLTILTGTPSSTLLMSAEDGLADTIRPRLDAVGADCSKIHALTGWRNAEDAPDEQRPFTLEHVPVLENALQQCRPRLVIIDPIQAYLGGKVDINRANETRPLLSMLARLAEAYHCAIVLVRHPAKGGQGRAIHRGLGSIDFIGAARTALFVEQHPLDPHAALLCQTKNNLGPLGRTHVFTKDRGEFHWKGVSRVNAEMLAGSGRGPDPATFLEAIFWLEQRLEGNLAWPSADIEEEGLGIGHKKDTLRRAKKALGVVSKKTPGGEGTWTWRLEPLAIVSLARETTSGARAKTTAVTSVSSVTSFTSPSPQSGVGVSRNGLEGQHTEVTEVTEERVEREERGVVERGVVGMKEHTEVTEEREGRQRGTI